MREKETNRDRFVRLATLRTNAVLKRLKVLGNCSNRSVYEYSEDDINKIFQEIDRVVKSTKTKFHYPVNINRKFKL